MSTPARTDLSDIAFLGFFLAVIFLVLAGRHVSSARDAVQACIDSGKDMLICKEIYGPW